MFHTGGFRATIPEDAYSRIERRPWKRKGQAERDPLGLFSIKRFENGWENLHVAQVFFISFMNPPLSWISRPF